MNLHKLNKPSFHTETSVSVHPCKKDAQKEAVILFYTHISTNSMIDLHGAYSRVGIASINCFVALIV
jgi:hypothetical protein